MRDRRALGTVPDGDLEIALRGLGRELAWPRIQVDSSTVDPAGRARLRIEQAPPSRVPRWGGRLELPHLRRPVRRALILALVALVVLAAVGAAFGLALPGIRFVFGPIASPAASSAPSLGSPSASRGANSATATPSATVPGPPGTGLDLGDPIAVSAASGTVDFPLLLPPRERYGSPVSAWLLAGRLSLVWQPGPELPATTDRDVGLILSEFRGSIDRGYFEKVIDQGTTITPVAVNGVTGFWITGRPHELVLVDPSGEPIFDGRLSVGDTLVWAGGDVTYRLESGLDQTRAVALAESLR